MATIIIENKELKVWVEQIYSILKDKSYGVSFSWDELASIINNPAISRAKLYQIIDKVNNKLMVNNRKYLETISGFGKRIIQPSEHSEVSRRSVKGAVRKYRKAGQVIASTNMDSLDEFQRKQIESDAMKWRTLELIGSEMSRKKVLVKDKDVKDDLVSDVIRLFSK